MTGQDDFKISISGLQEEDVFVRNSAQSEISRELSDFSRTLGIISFSMHVRKYHEEGKRVKYSLRARLSTDDGSFFAQDHGWNLMKAVKSVMNKLRHEISGREGRSKVRGRTTE